MGRSEGGESLGPGEEARRDEGMGWQDGWMEGVGLGEGAGKDGEY